MNSPRWLIRGPGGPRRCRLYCFPCAGGNPFRFLRWQTLLDSAVEVCAVQLPGRGSRLTEAPYRSFPPLIKALSEVIFGEETQRFAFFGHSLGALIAFELARYCTSRGLLTAEHLFVSGCDAPQYGYTSPRLHDLPDAAFKEALRRYNGTPAEVLANQELLALLLPVIRADFALAETYEYAPSTALNIPITVLAGTLDDQVVPEQVEGWRQETTAKCRVRWLEGDHFFVDSKLNAVIACVNGALRGARYI
jgi:surfactin synthase thioesterase subunit